MDDIVKYFRKNDADIIALQEVSDTTYLGITANAATLLARELDMNVHYCRTMINEKHTPPYELGNAILSRLPFASTACLPLNPPGTYDGSPASEPRAACEAMVRIGTTIVRILSVHVYHPHKPPADDAAKEQFGALNAMLDDRPTILMGDFNTETDSPLMSDITDRLATADDGKHPTFRNIKYDPDETRIFDHVCTSKHFEVTDQRVSAEDASDHMPVLCELLFTADT